jgi:L-lysine exporter family protein LysE/ArgO
VELSIVIAGLGLGLSLIVAIGAQNLFVLRQGIRREHVFAVATVCAVSDAVLILVGVSGVGAVLQAVPWLIDAVRWAGAAFLVVYGLLAARRALRPSGEALAVDAAEHAGEPVGEREDATRGPGSAPASAEASTHGPSAVATRPAARAPGTTTLAAALATCLALTWLNPHVYLDTVFLLGTVANTHGDDGRWAFALGAAVASVLWFFGLAYGARLLGRVLSSPRAWRILDGVIAVVMIALGVSLVLPH